MEDIQGVIREFVTWLKAKGEVDSSVTYDEAIDEFTDWLTCRNDLTGVSVSGEDMPASGASIRTLIRSKLKVPFVTHVMVHLHTLHPIGANLVGSILIHTRCSALRILLSYATREH